MTRRAAALWGPLTSALALEFWLSSLPQIPAARLVWDKALHACGYAGIGVLALRAIHGGLAELRPRPTLGAGAFVVLYGISDEFHQSFVPGRDASVGDVLADSAGFLLAAALVSAWAAWRGTSARPAAGSAD